ncbi:MAG TPA: hypothetical protein DGN59_03115 [Candidatus Latescibacteria bacterium]|nr:hypothetical protein [Candidatus Latescibacterota bacterium]
MKTMRAICPLLLALLAIGGCSDRGDFVYGSPLSDEPLRVFDETAGIHPSKAVLEDPNNPFARASSGAQTKWDLQGTGNHVTAYYSWATWLAHQPTGEHQYYVGVSLRDIWANGEARQADLSRVHDMAIAAFQSVLDNFPDAKSFDSTGTFSFELVTASYRGILDLGGTPSGNWLLVTDPNGNEKAVRR